MALTLQTHLTHTYKLAKTAIQLCQLGCAQAVLCFAQILGFKQEHTHTTPKLELKPLQINHHSQHADG